MYSFGFRKALRDNYRLILGEMNLGLDNKELILLYRTTVYSSYKGNYNYLS